MLKARTGGYWPVRAVDRYEGLSGDFPAAQHVPQRTQEQQPAAQGKAPADPQGGQKGGGKQGRDLRRLPPVPRRPAVRSVRSTGTAGHRPPCSAGSPPCRNWQHGQPWADSPIHRTERTGRRWPFRRRDRRRFPPPGPPPRKAAGTAAETPPAAALWPPTAAAVPGSGSGDSPCGPSGARWAAPPGQ